MVSDMVFGIRAPALVFVALAIMFALFLREVAKNRDKEGVIIFSSLTVGFVLGAVFTQVWWL